MAVQDDKSCLGYLGAPYQYNLVKELIEDKEYFKDLSSILDQNSFTEPILKSVVTIMRDHYAKHGSVPGYDTIKIYLADQAHTTYERESNLAAVDKLRNMSVESPDMIKEKADVFFKQQNIVKAANMILKIAADGDTSKYSQIEDILHKALNAGKHDNHLFRLFDDYEETLSKDYRCPIPTGIGKLDEALEGGLGKGELATIVGASGYGKALSVNELVATPNGWVRMGDIHNGDYVLGRNGKPCKVVGVYPQGIRPIYKVTFTDGSSCECDLEHLWSVCNVGNRRAKSFTYKAMTLREIIESGLYFGQQKKVCKYMIPTADKVQYNAKKVLCTPYLFGYFLGSGDMVTNTISVPREDSDEVVNILRKSNFDFTKIDNGKRNITLRFGDGFRMMFQSYFQEGFTKLNSFIPNDYKVNSERVRVDLLCGLMDSSGSFDKEGVFKTRSSRIAQDVYELALSLGCKASIKTGSARSYEKKNGEVTDYDTTYYVHITLYDKSIRLFGQDSKQNGVTYRTGETYHRLIESVNYLRDDHAQCITVDAEDALYLTRDFIVTHNTSMTTALASYAATYKCDYNNNRGFKVLQIVFEDTVKQLRRKHFSRLSEVEARKLSYDEENFKVREATDIKNERCQMLQENLLIGSYPSGELSPVDIRNILKECENNGFKVDLLIIDYFECLKLLRGMDGDKWDAEGVTMRKLETVTKEFNVATWVPIQGTKDSLNADIVTMDKGGGSFKKLQIAHIDISITRSMEDVANNRAKISILKNRAGQAGATLDNVYFDNGTCTINTDNAQTFSDILKYNAKREEDQSELAKAIFMAHKERRKMNIDEPF